MNKEEQILEEVWKARHPYDVLFLEIMDGYEIEVSDICTDSIFYTKGDNILIELDKKTKEAYICYPLILEVFESEFSLNNKKMREIMILMMDKHLKLNGYKPRMM